MHIRSYIPKWACAVRQVRLSHSARAPLFHLVDAKIPGLPHPLSWTIGDNGSDELWAIVGPASDAGGQVRKGICEVSPC